MAMFRFSRGKKQVSIPCLIDGGAATSVVDRSCLETLELDLGIEVERDFTTFYGEPTTRVGCTTSVNVHIPGSTNLAVPMFVEDKYQLDIFIPGIQDVLKNFQEEKVPIIPNYPEWRDDAVAIRGVIGSDIIQLIPE